MIAVMLLVLLSLAGLLDASYITIEAARGVTPPCHLKSIFDCGAVLNSQWSHLGPLPLSALGIVFYGVFFVLASLHMLKPNVDRRLTLFMGVWALGGLAFTGYLTFIQAVVIGAFCFYCVISAATSTSLFVVTALGFGRRIASAAKELRHDFRTK